MTDWNERIPAAIAKGKELLGPLGGEGGDAIDSLFFDDGQSVTAGEVALAKALWRVTMAEGWHIDPALREFVAKVEGLSHG